MNSCDECGCNGDTVFMKYMAKNQYFEQGYYCTNKIGINKCVSKPGKYNVVLCCSEYVLHFRNQV
jgi:hypothetical protein